MLIVIALSGTQHQLPQHLGSVPLRLLTREQTDVQGPRAGETEHSIGRKDNIEGY